MTVSDEFLWLTVACAILTFATRAGGYLILSRLAVVPPRLEQALDAVPAAVMAALVAPAALSGTWREAVAMLLCAFLFTRFGLSTAVFVALGALIAMRAFT